MLPQAPHEVELENRLVIVTLVLQPINDFLEIWVSFFQELLALSKTELPEGLTPRCHHLKLSERLTYALLCLDGLLPRFILITVEQKVDGANNSIQRVMVLYLLHAKVKRNLKCSDEPAHLSLQDSLVHAISMPVIEEFVVL